MLKIWNNANPLQIITGPGISYIYKQEEDNVYLPQNHQYHQICPDSPNSPDWTILANFSVTPVLLLHVLCTTHSTSNPLAFLIYSRVHLLVQLLCAVSMWRFSPRFGKNLSPRRWKISEQAILLHLSFIQGSTFLCSFWLNPTLFPINQDICLLLGFLCIFIENMKTNLLHYFQGLLCSSGASLMSTLPDKMW